MRSWRVGSGMGLEDSQRVGATPDGRAGIEYPVFGFT